MHSRPHLRGLPRFALSFASRCCCRATEYFWITLGRCCTFSMIFFVKPSCGYLTRNGNENEKSEEICSVLLFLVDRSSVLRIEKCTRVPRNFSRQILSSSSHNELRCRPICRARVDARGFHFINVQLVLPQRVTGGQSDQISPSTHQRKARFRQTCLNGGAAYTGSLFGSTSAL